MDVVVGTIANTAFSFTLAGNSGISPFLTMFLIGAVQKAEPEKFNMSNTMDKIMSSWPMLTFWSIMTILEYVGKCVPVVDQIVDSAEIFVVPLLSTLGSFSSFGSFETIGEGLYDGNNNNNNDRYLESKQSTNEMNNRNQLRGLSTTTSSVTSGVRAFFQIIIVFVGVIIALSLHFFKMLIRLFGEGCLTQCIAIGEATTVCFGVLVSIFIRQFAILIATCMLLAAGYGAKRKYVKWQAKQEQELEVARQEMHNTTRHTSNGSGNEAKSQSTSEYAWMDDKPADGSRAKV
eukprot:scaffold114_cov200-Alexandrium_tamarense.AAC.81